MQCANVQVVALVVTSFASVEELYRSAKDLLRVASQLERMESPQGMTYKLFIKDHDKIKALFKY